MRCLIVDELHPSIGQGLKNCGIDYSYEPTISRTEIKRKIKDYEGLIIRSKTIVDGDLIADAHCLKFVARAGAGVDNFDVELLARKKITIINAPEGNRDAVAEHTLGLILALLNNFAVANQQVKDMKWDRESNRGEELKGKTVGIFGFGNMGTAFAQRLIGFGCEIIGYDRYKSGFGNDYYREVGLKELYNQTDILSLHVPLTDETQGMINYKFLELFKKSIILINTSRGEIVPLEALVKSLAGGKVRKAALDVLEYEQFAKCSPAQKNLLDKVLSNDNILVTPHIAGWTNESFRKINEVLIHKICSLYKPH